MNVITIPAKPQKGNNAAKVEVKKLRVAAYCRVSTDNEEQATSYEAQIAHYREFISSNPDWMLVDVYADDGISATSTKNREEFNRMIEDCKQGKIDMIFTKSISRFARNTVDCLNYIRELKGMNIPVFFEKESINTMDAKGEVMLTIMASLAQQESESLSQNVKLGLQYGFQQGKVMVNTRLFLGYDKDAEGNLIINPEQAEIVKRIFREYLEGASCKKIGRGLERDGILTVRGSSRWHDSTIRKILENEKYMGDVLLQKTYTVDFLRKKRVVNNGVMPQYYIEGHHEPIIPKELFLKVQEEIARRGSERDCLGKKRGFSSNHCFSQMVYCAECGEQYRRIHWNNRGKKSIVWRCTTRLHDKEKCRAKTVSEALLQEAFLYAVNEMLGDSSVYLKRLKENLETAIHLTNPDSTEALAARMAALQVGGQAVLGRQNLYSTPWLTERHGYDPTCSVYLKRLKENLETAIHLTNPDSTEALGARMAALQQELIDRTSRRENYDDLAEEILHLREVQAQTVMDDAAKAEHKKRIRELRAFIRSQPYGITEFDETLVKHLVERVTVFGDYLVFRLKSGVEVVVEK